MPTLTLSDSAAVPTGEIALIAGSDPAVVNTLSGVRVEDVYGDPWAAKGTRTGDGAVSLALPTGSWWVYLLSTPPTGPPVATPPQTLVVTDGRDKPATRCRTAVAARIASLNLPASGTVGGLDYLGEPKAILSMIAPDDSNDKFPVIVLTADGLSEGRRGGTNAYDEVGYPVKVLIADKNEQYQHKRLPGFERWRYLIDRAFDGQRLPGVPESLECTVEPLPVVQDGLPLYSHLVSGLVIRCWRRVPRGLNV